jgi:hypothetical protein
MFKKKGINKNHYFEAHTEPIVYGENEKNILYVWLYKYTTKFTF